MVNIIIIRGNSGSGKTTVARKLHEILGRGNLLISQDVVRREMLNVHDRPFNLAIPLIEKMLIFGIEHCEFVILEGILAENKYGDMLRNVLNNRMDNVFAYYYDLSFEETVRRHNSKKETDFGLAELKSWFVANDYLGFPGEKSISKALSIEETINNILTDIRYRH